MDHPFVGVEIGFALALDKLDSREPGFIRPNTGDRQVGKDGRRRPIDGFDLQVHGIPAGLEGTDLVEDLGGNGDAGQTQAQATPGSPSRKLCGSHSNPLMIN
jgi:hypothetical protein